MMMARSIPGTVVGAGGGGEGKALVGGSASVGDLPGSVARTGNRSGVGAVVGWRCWSGA
jgi:hypothetical protein